MDAAGPRRRAPSTASAARCRPSRPARRCRSAPRTSATTGRRSTASSTRSTRSWTSCWPATTDAERREELGDLLMVLVNVGRWHGIEAEAALRAGNEKFRRRFRRASSGRPRSAGSRCATSTSRRWTRCGMPPRPRSGRRRTDVTHRESGPAMAHRSRTGRSGRRPGAARPAAGRLRSSASRSGPRARAGSASATRRCCARRRSRTVSRRICAARAPAG